jgi:hypothetical protein
MASFLDLYHPRLRPISAKATQSPTDHTSSFLGQRARSFNTKAPSRPINKFGDFVLIRPGPSGPTWCGPPRKAVGRGETP